MNVNHKPFKTETVKLRKFIKQNRKLFLLGAGYLMGFTLLSICSFLYFYFRNPLVLIGFLVLVFIASYLMPLWFRLFLKVKPYNGPYKKPLMKFSGNTKISIKELYVRKSNESNAYAIGYWNNKSVVLNSNTLNQHPYDEIKAVMAHELGHHINKDVYFYTVIIAIILSVGSWINIVINLDFSSNLWLTTFIISTILLPVILLISRWREGLADSYAKKILKDSSALARFFERSTVDALRYE